MAANGWEQARAWSEVANKIAPTLVGGSKKHGGPDLGPTRARKAWAELGIDGLGIANEAPNKDFTGMPRLTPRMMARLQGFPDDWTFGPRKTTACRMIGNAFPPPVACAIGLKIKEVLDYERINSRNERKVTGEPMPSRLASLALGTGDIDCVYHFALYELMEAVNRIGAEDSIELLNILVNGKRLKDISDMPLDLAV